MTFKYIVYTANSSNHYYGNTPNIHGIFKSDKSAEEFIKNNNLLRAVVKRVVWEE